MRLKLLLVIPLILALLLFSSPVAALGDEAQFDPWCYDFDQDGKVCKQEALIAVSDYFGYIITKAHVLWIIELYFEG